MNRNDIKSVIKWALSLLILVIVFLFFNWWGVVGYFAFVFLVAGYLLYKRWETYMLIVKYGSDQLHKLGGKKQNDKNKFSNKKEIKKSNI